MDIKLEWEGLEGKVKISQTEKDFRKKALRALSVVGMAGVNIIQDRTSQSRSFKGGSFKPYTSDYAAFRKSKGRQKLPDLEFKGTMMGSITSRVKGVSAEIFFTRATEAAKAAKNNEKRPFFGFSRAEERKLTDIFLKVIA